MKQQMFLQLVIRRSFVWTFHHWEPSVSSYWTDRNAAIPRRWQSFAETGILLPYHVWYRIFATHLKICIKNYKHALLFSAAPASTIYEVRILQGQEICQSFQIWHNEPMLVHWARATASVHGHQIWARRFARKSRTVWVLVNAETQTGWRLNLKRFSY